MKLRWIVYTDQHGSQTKPVLQYWGADFATGAMGATIIGDGKWHNVETVIEDIEVEYGDDNKSKNLELELMKKGVL